MTCQRPVSQFDVHLRAPLDTRIQSLVTALCIEFESVQVGTLSPSEETQFAEPAEACSFANRRSSRCKILS